MAGVGRREIEKWLGVNHPLSRKQIDQLVRDARAIWERYPNADDHEERDAALTVAYRLLVEDPVDVIAELGAARAQARETQARAVAGLRQAARTVIRPGGRGIASKQGFAKVAGVSRSTVVDRWVDET